MQVSSVKIKTKIDMDLSILANMSLTSSFSIITETKALMTPQTLVKMHIKMIEALGNAVIFKAILVR